jgi:hypothetical protein
MADDRTPSSPEKLKQVLDRLNDVLSEAARLRSEVMRQLTEQRNAAQQHLSPRTRKTAQRKR